MRKLGFGFMRLPVLDENDRSTVDIEIVKEMVDLFMARGFTYFDTAHRYNDEASGGCYFGKTRRHNGYFRPIN